MIPIINILKSEVFRIVGIIIIVILIILVLVFIGGGCMSFDLIWEDRLPPECNMSINMLNMYYKSDEKSAVAVPMDYCFKCLRRIRCQGEVFGFDENGNPNPVDYNDLNKLNNFNRCMEQLQ